MVADVVKVEVERIVVLDNPCSPKRVDIEGIMVCYDMRWSFVQRRS